MSFARSGSPVDRYLHSLHERFGRLDEGTVATYIPELGKADPRWFGIAIATADGQVYEVGETQQPFTIQSISKPFVYGLALEDQGKEAVLRRIGVEPTGDAFNQISLESTTGRPRNPMINAGAIAAASLVAGSSAEDRWNRTLSLFGLYTGHSVELDEVVYRSERDTGHRNRAIGHMLRNFGILEQDPEEALDRYFRQCSIAVTCRDLAVMAACLATGGRNPLTGERALASRNVNEVLSVMTTCGMYDYAGEWLYRVGLPAKSGVSGGLLAVLPGQLGIGVFSPPLDARGNSVRGVAVCSALSEELDLHFLRPPRAALSVVRNAFHLKERRSRRVRPQAEREQLLELGERAWVYTLQGDLNFSAMEVVTRRLGAAPQAERVVLDLERVHDVDTPAARLLLELLQAAYARRRTLAIVGLQRHSRLRRFFEESRLSSAPFDLVVFDELDLALEWCEKRLLEGAGFGLDDRGELPLCEHELLEGFGAAEVQVLSRLLERREFAVRELAVRKGDAADELFLVVRGELSVLSEDRRGDLRRLATICSGMGFGESFLVPTATRTASVRADQPATCWVLSRAAAAQLDETHPGIKIRLLGNLLRDASRIVARLSNEALGERL